MFATEIERMTASITRYQLQLAKLRELRPNVSPAWYAGQRFAYLFWIDLCREVIAADQEKGA